MLLTKPAPWAGGRVVGFASCQAWPEACLGTGVNIPTAKWNGKKNKQKEKKKTPDIAKPRRGRDKSTQIHSNKLIQTACSEHKRRNDPD